jgi:hypothetical protein
MCEYEPLLISSEAIMESGVSLRYHQGYFCDRMHWDAVLEVLSQEKPEWCSRTFYTGISRTNISPLQPNFGDSVRSGTSF